MRTTLTIEPAVAVRLQAPGAEIVSPGPAHAGIVFNLLETVGVAYDLTTDAHLAALAIEHHAESATTDRDFARFRGVRHFNPAIL